MDWWIQRIATSKHYSTDPHAVRYVWSFADVLESHMALDALDDIAEIFRPDPPKGR